MALMVAAPAVVHASNLMPIKPWHDAYAYGWNGEGMFTIGTFRIGDSIDYRDAMLVTTLKKDKAVDYINDIDGFQELIKGKSEAWDIPAARLGDLDFSHNGTLYHAAPVDWKEQAAAHWAKVKAAAGTPAQWWK